MYHIRFEFVTNNFTPMCNINSNESDLSKRFCLLSSVGKYLTYLSLKCVLYKRILIEYYVFQLKILSIDRGIEYIDYYNL